MKKTIAGLGNDDITIGITINVFSNDGTEIGEFTSEVLSDEALHLVIEDVAEYLEELENTHDVENIYDLMN
jgi:hypothetical protein